MQMESQQELLAGLKEIEKWEKEQKGGWIWDKLIRLPFKLLDKFTPKFIQNKIGELLDELGSFIQTGGRYLFSEKAVFRFLEKTSGWEVTQLSDFDHVPIEVMKEASLKLGGRRKQTATVQGASTGVGGVFTLAIDIPAILAMSLTTLQEIAMLHGYDPKDKKERVFILKCLQFSLADVVGKEAILKELSQFDSEAKSRDMASQLQGWREVTLTFTEQFGFKKLLQMVPVAGILFGAISNRFLIGDLAEAGTMLYQKRRILERLKKKEQLT
ncbi:EcsC family protein [Jeotgalibacillus aurantiacus]|uniref:EcsC family protein n=1 Tax=Jeotgalibacillus aurantiacus TaxID=2763266 RepID=UPI001D0A80DB|nr:EcsC family protein [Jeotgalibacillus aurantiacus]